MSNEQQRKSNVCPKCASTLELHEYGTYYDKTPIRVTDSGAAIVDYDEMIEGSEERQGRAAVCPSCNYNAPVEVDGETHVVTIYHTQYPHAYAVKTA